MEIPRAHSAPPLPPAGGWRSLQAPPKWLAAQLCDLMLAHPSCRRPACPQDFQTLSPLLSRALCKACVAVPAHRDTPAWTAGTTHHVQALECRGGGFFPFSLCPILPILFERIASRGAPVPAAMGMPMMMASLTPSIASVRPCSAASNRWSVVFSKEASMSTLSFILAMPKRVMPSTSPCTRAGVQGFTV